MSTSENSFEFCSSEVPLCMYPTAPDFPSFDPESIVMPLHTGARVQLEEFATKWIPFEKRSTDEDGLLSMSHQFCFRLAEHWKGLDEEIQTWSILNQLVCSTRHVMTCMAKHGKKVRTANCFIGVYLPNSDQERDMPTITLASNTWKSLVGWSKGIHREIETHYEPYCEIRIIVSFSEYGQWGSQ